jgi:hypothetical protein
MSVSVGRSTYRQLIDDFYYDTKDIGFSDLPDEAVMVWIMEAERKICEQCEVRERYTLGLNTSIDEYSIQDRPPITNITNTSPMVVTATDNDLIENDRILVRDVNGTDSANGYFQAVSVGPSQFTLDLYADIADATNANPIVITTKKAHPFTSGMTGTIMNVAGNTNANGTFLFTKLSPTTFSIPVAGNGSYVGGGLALAPSVSSGVYVSGGKFWRNDELPTYFAPNSEDIIQRTWGNFKPTIKVVEMGQLIEQMQKDQEVQKVYSDYDSPVMMAEWAANSNRFLKFYPAPYSDQDIDIYGRVQLFTRASYPDKVGDYILLATRYDEAIIHFITWKGFLWMKKMDLAQYHFALWSEAIHQLKVTRRRHISMSVDSR